MAPSGKKSAAAKPAATPAVSAKPDVIAAAMTPLPHDETVTPAITAKAEKIAKEMTAKGKKPAAVKAPAAAAPAETPAPKKKAAPKKKPEAAEPLAEEPAGEAAAPATRRPMSAYNKFIKYRLFEMTVDSDYAEMAHKDKFKAAGEEWKSLSDQEKADILERAEAYIAELNEPAKPPRKKRAAKAAKGAKAASEEEAPAAPVKKEKRHRAPTTYNFFMAHRIHELTESHPELTHRERFTMSAAEWKTLEGEDKENAIAEAMRYHEQKEAEKAAAAAPAEEA